MVDIVLVSSDDGYKGSFNVSLSGYIDIIGYIL